VVIKLKNVVDPQLNKSKHDFTPEPSAGATGQAGQTMLNNCKDKGRNGLDWKMLNFAKVSTLLS